MKNLAILLFCVLLQPGLVAGQKGFVKDGLGEKLDDLMTDFSKEGYSGAALVADLNFRRRVAPAIERTIWQSVSKRK